jgi:hypothetical protein
VLGQHYRRNAEPYLKKALASSDKKILDGALFVIGLGHWQGLQPEVRKVAWSANDELIQRMATSTLRDLKDAEGLREIAKRHPNEAVRKAASSDLGELEKEKEKWPPFQ